MVGNLEVICSDLPVGSNPEITLPILVKVSKVELPHGPREVEACSSARTPRPS